MKKVIAILLVLVLAVSLCACGNPYEKYEYINKMLDEGDYEGAVKAIYQLYMLDQNANGNNGGNDGGDGGGDNNDGGNDDGGNVQVDPTDEEIKLLDQYYKIYNFLNSYTENSYSSVQDCETEKYYEGQEALKFCFEKLPELGGIDKWADSDYVKDHWNYSEIENWDRMSFVRCFTVIEDVILNMSSTQKDNLGNVGENDSLAKWYYDVDGKLIRQSGERYTRYLWHLDQYNDTYYEYDSAGKVTQKKYGYGDTVNALVTYTYEGSKITNEHLKTNSGEWDFVYSYDESGRLTQIAWQESETRRYAIDYTYDAAGNLIKEEKTAFYLGSLVQVWTKDAKYIVEYTYTDGKLSSGTYTYQAWGYDQDVNNSTWYVKEEYITQQRVNQYTFTCDVKGRVLTQTEIPGATYYMRGEDEGKVCDTPSYASKTYETVYGDYYIYTPAN